MKTLFRVLVIVTVAVLIGGLMYAGVNASGSTSSFTGFEGSRERPQFTEGSESQLGGEGFRPDRDEDREGGFGFPGGVLKAVVLMTIAGGIYSGIVWMGKKAKRASALQ